MIHPEASTDHERFTALVPQCPAIRPALGMFDMLPPDDPA